MNGEFYGAGDWSYLTELLENYVLVMNMYSSDEVEFKIVKIGDNKVGV
ncbi:hypothetical protein [Bacillus sp. S0628]|nr:hypothetical protein [Bacillus sp. S0628]